jgi:hypothetical protein
MAARVALFVAAGLSTGLAAAQAAADAAAPMAQCRAELSAAATAKLRLCEEHAACRNVARVIDRCSALRTFIELLAAQGPGKVDDRVLRRALVEAGVPAGGLGSCTSEFNRALCRNFLNLEDASGDTAAGPSRTAQFELALKRLVEQHDRARVPADAHRAAELKLEACALARPGTEREAPCREAVEAVQACGLFRDEWAQRREVLLVDAERLALAAPRQQLRSLQLPPCPQTLPGSNLTPAQAVNMLVEDGAAPAQAPAPAAPAPQAPAPGPAPAPAPAPSARADANGNNSECRTALRRMEERFEGINRRRPPQAANLAVQQVELYMLSEQVALLERLCRGQREYEFLKPMQERLARTQQACRASAAQPGSDCVPRVAW